MGDSFKAKKKFSISENKLKLIVQMAQNNYSYEYITKHLKIKTMKSVILILMIAFTSNIGFSQRIGVNVNGGISKVIRVIDFMDNNYRLNKSASLFYSHEVNDMLAFTANYGFGKMKSSYEGNYSYGSLDLKYIAFDVEIDLRTKHLTYLVGFFNNSIKEFKDFKNSYDPIIANEKVRGIFIGLEKDLTDFMSIGTKSYFSRKGVLEKEKSFLLYHDIYLSFYIGDLKNKMKQKN